MTNNQQKAYALMRLYVYDWEYNTTVMQTFVNFQKGRIIGQKISGVQGWKLVLFVICELIRIDLQPKPFVASTVSWSSSNTASYLLILHPILHY